MDTLSSSDAVNTLTSLAEGHLIYYRDNTVSVYQPMDTKPQRLRCEYCGCLSEKDYGTCEHCGAPL